MLRGHLVQSTALIFSSIALLWSAQAISQNPTGLPPLPAPDAVTAEIDQLRQESARLSQEARELGGGRTIADAASSVHNSFYGHKAQADELEQLALDMGHTAEELRAEQRRIAETGRIGLGELGKGAAGQVVDKVAEEAIKRFIAEVYGKIFGVLSFGKDCYDATRRIKLWLLTRQQAGSLGDSAESVRQNWIALNQLLVALYGEMSLEAAKMRRLDAIQQRSRAIQDRIATLQQGAADAQQPATSHAGTTRETDSGYDQLLYRIEMLKFERRIAALRGDDREVRRLDREIAPLERQAEQAEQVPARRGVGLAPRPLHRTSATELCPPRAQPTETSSLPPPPPGSVGARILDVHNKERAAVGVAPLQWDPQLAASGSAYAVKLAAGGPFVHAPRTGRENERENLSRGLPGASPERMMINWTGEKSNFIPGIYPNVSKTGSWYDVSHYTQMIWPTTTRVGCGTARGAGQEVLVCRYTPPGNRPGKPVIANDRGIAPPTSATPINPRDIPRLPMGGGMQQLDPPPPPPPTARDDAPEGKEENHPLVRYGVEADARHAAETDCGNATMARLELEKMRYALDELKKRLKAARKAGRFSAVKPEDVQRQIDEMERRIREAEPRKPRGACPPGGRPPPPPPPPPR